MCGIAGFSGPGDRDLLERMNAALAHRGPDDAGVLMLPEEGLGLAHRRLSIIDLSPRGRQPMWDAAEKVAITYNGELYNYRELRAELVAQGFEFRSHSDTEVLLNLYLRDGPEMLPKLNGIFAFALWDAADRSLLVARDGLGVKPLYWSQTRGRFAFASELKALLQDEDLDREVDAEAVRHHLIYLWCPAPQTMLRSVRKLEPGHALRVRGGRVERSWRYWDVPLGRGTSALSETDAVRQVESAVRRAVERQLVSDVPVGAFLSGGLDSSSIVALARRALPGERMQCFTIGFRDRGTRFEGMTQDLPYARRAAEHLDVDLHVITVGSEMVDELEAMVFHLDEPQADPAPLNALFISRLAREHGIKVLLSGAGGDDIFTGYRRHVALGAERWWSWLPRPARGALARAARAVRPTTALRRRASRALQFADLDGDARIASYFYWLAPAAAEPLLGPRLRGGLEAPPDAPLRRALGSLPETATPLERMLYLEAKFFLADHNLNYTDKMSMATGVEVRVPLLDPDLVELASRLPDSLKQHGREGKWVFRRAMAPYLPAEILERPKTGFGAPLRQWLHGDLQPLLEDVLSDVSLEKRGLFDPGSVRELLRRDRERRIDASYTLFSLVCIELWCRMFLDPRTPALAIPRSASMDRGAVRAGAGGSLA